jgi:hypothetical protein
MVIARIRAAGCGHDITGVAPRRCLAACALLALPVLAGPAVAEAAADWDLAAVERVVAVSDLHGAHRAFVETLAGAGIVDATGAWTGGRAHLVINGDIVDRGEESRASLEFLMRLEPQAAAAGGGVHVVLGNHDVMNLVGDLRYASKGEFAAFAGEETPAQRDEAYARHVARAQADAPPLPRVDFDARFPPGFFAHRAAFAASGRYGRWLLGKPVALRIGDTLFVHAGVSAALPVTSLAELAAMRDAMVEFATLLEQAIARGLLDATTDYYDMPRELGAGDPAAPAPVADPLAQRLLALREAPVQSATGPLWYRGNVGCGPLIEQDRLARMLGRLGAKRVVIGHTPTLRRQAWRRLQDQVWMIDTGMQRAYFSGQGTALVLEGGAMSAVYQGTARPVPIDEPPLRDGALTANLTAAALEEALASGEIVARSPAPEGETITLRWKGTELDAFFRPADSARGPFPEAAAYRLDRLLDLGMVPAAVVRSIDGRPGTVLYLPPSLVPEARRAAGEVRVDAWCPLQDQWAAMYLFDALIGNAPRTAQQILYAPGDGQLVLAGHGQAFGTGAGIPAHLRNAPLAVNPEWRRRLTVLGSTGARDQLAGVLTDRQHAALLKRARALLQ